MKRSLLILIASAVLILGFQNCGGFSQLPLSLGGDSQKPFSSLRIGFPYTWSTDTGNVDYSERPTAKTAVEDIASSICYLYSAKVELGEKECVSYLLSDRNFINLFHQLSYPYETYQQLSTASDNNIIRFVKISGDECLQYIDSNQIEIIKNDQLASDDIETYYAKSFAQIYDVVASSNSCYKVIQSNSTGFNE